MAAKKHSRTTGLDAKRADIQDVWINENSKCYFFTCFFPGSTTENNGTYSDVVTGVIITPGL